MDVPASVQQGARTVSDMAATSARLHELQTEHQALISALPRVDDKPVIPDELSSAAVDLRNRWLVVWRALHAK